MIDKKELLAAWAALPEELKAKLPERARCENIIAEWNEFTAKQVE